MNRPLIVRGLWGDSETCGRDRFRKHENQLAGRLDLEQTLYDMAERQEPCDAFVAFGEANSQLAQSFGLPVLRASRYPWLYRERALPPSEHRYPAAVYRGVNGHRHKLVAMLTAMASSGKPILWLDLRVRLVRPLDSAWWDQFRPEDAFRAAMIRQYNARFGAVWRYMDGPAIDGVPQRKFVTNHDEAKWLPGGGCLFVRDKSLLLQALRIAHRFAWWSDQQCLAAALDRRHGGWLGERKWSRLYGLTGYYYGRNRHYSEPSQTYFECGRRLSKAEHRWRLWR
jgi:hypothetical protein